MRKWGKVLVFSLLLLGTVVTAGIAATIGWRPFIGPKMRPLTARTFEATPARLERGRYLTGAVAACVLCHSELKTTPDGGLFVPAGTEFTGRSFAPDQVPFVTAPNLTPDVESGIGSWPDDALARAIREGISHDGRTLFPVMPYEKLRAMSDEDLASVIVYLRSLAPIKRTLPKTAVPFPVNRLINTVPEPVGGPVTPDLSTPEKRGQYLTSLAVCADCHTPRTDQGVVTPGMDFAGGTTIHFEGSKEVASANLTPATNGIPYYTEELFIETLRTGRVRERKLNDMMPWQHYGKMTDEDLKDIFAYLKSLKPVEHYIDNTMPLTECAFCGLRHGGGERNHKKS